MLIRSWFSLNHATEEAFICLHLSDAGDRYCQSECEEDFLLTASDLTNYRDWFVHHFVCHFCSKTHCAIDQLMSCK